MTHKKKNIGTGKKLITKKMVKERSGRERQYSKKNRPNLMQKKGKNIIRQTYMMKSGVSRRKIMANETPRE